MKSFIYALIAVLISVCSLSAQDAPKNKTVSPLNELKKNYFEGKYKEALFAYLHYENELTAEEAYYLGMTDAALYNFDGAVNYLETAILKDSTNTGYEYQLAKTYLMVGRTQTAEKRFAHLLMREPNYLPALFDAGILDYSQKKYTEAVRKFKLVTKLTPANFLAFFNLAKAYSNMEPAPAYLDSVSTYLSTAVSINSDYLPAVEMLGTFYFNHRIYDQALQLFLTAARKNPARADFYYLAGMCWEKESKYDKAIELYNQAIELNGKEAHYWDHHGFSNYMLNNFQVSILSYKKAIKLDGENASFYMNLGYAYIKTDSAKQAVEAFETAAARMHPEEIGKIICQAGHVYYGQNNYTMARKEYQAALFYDPVNIDALYLLAICDQKLNNPAAALAGYKKALQLISENTPEIELSKNEQYNTIKGLIASLTKRTKKGIQ